MKRATKAPPKHRSLTFAALLPILSRDREGAVAAGSRGDSLVEFALVAPLLLLVIAGVLDFAMLLRTAACAADAARSGAQYGSLSVANSTNLAGMRAAALNAAPGISGLTATASQSCQCPAGVAADCGATCAGGLLVYVRVVTQATAHTMFNYAPLGFSGTVSASASMRAQ